MARVAVIGECLVELRGAAFGTLLQSFGGDTLNTALYLSRLLRPTSGPRYVTAIGKDVLSEAMLQRWVAEGIEVGSVLRDAARLPGLYQIQVDERGERSFLYWRQHSAARFLLQHPDFGRVEAALSTASLIFLSGISLAILPAADRASMIDLLVRLADRGVTLAFDTNYRASLWSSPVEARSAIEAMLPVTRLLFVTFEDEQRLWGDESPLETQARYAARGRLLAIKLGAEGCLCVDGSEVSAVPAVPVATVVDTTAAGDSFNAAFIAAWLQGRSSTDCCRAGNALAASVIQHHGAIVEAATMPSLAQLLGDSRAAPIPRHTDS